MPMDYDSIEIEFINAENKQSLYTHVYLKEVILTDLFADFSYKLQLACEDNTLPVQDHSLKMYIDVDQTKLEIYVKIIIRDIEFRDDNGIFLYLTMFYAVL